MDLILIILLVILLLLIGKESFFNVIRFILRGVFFILVVGLVIYVVSFHWDTIVLHAREFWFDLKHLITQN